MTSQTEPAARGVGRLAGIAVALLSAVLVALLAASILLLVQRHALRGGEADRERVLNAARQQAVNIVSLDATTVDRDYDRMLAGAADPLRAELQKNRAAARDALARSKGSSSGTVTDAGLVELQGDRASVVVILDAVQTNRVTRSTLSHRFRFQLDLARQGGRWLVANLQSIDICASGAESEPGCAPQGSGSTQDRGARPSATPKPTPTKR